MHDVNTHIFNNAHLHRHTENVIINNMFHMKSNKIYIYMCTHMCVYEWVYVILPQSQPELGVNNGAPNKANLALTVQSTNPLKPLQCLRGFIECFIFPKSLITIFFFFDTRVYFFVLFWGFSVFVFFVVAVSFI